MEVTNGVTDEKSGKNIHSLVIIRAVAEIIWGN